MGTEARPQNSSNRALAFLCLVACGVASYMFFQTFKLDSAIHPSSVWAQTPRLQFAVSSEQVIKILNEWAEVNPNYRETARVALEFDNKNILSYGLALLLLMFWVRGNSERFGRKILLLPLLAVSADFAENALLHRFIFEGPPQGYAALLLFALATVKLLAVIASAVVALLSRAQSPQTRTPDKS